MAQWSGWWEQRGLGRQAMHDLCLDLGPAGEVTGSGVDCVGPFRITGNIAATVKLVKQYVGQHSLVYIGTNSGEGIFGTWHLPEMPVIPGLTEGRFALFPTGNSAHSDAAIAELEPACRQ